MHFPFLISITNLYQYLSCLDLHSFFIFFFGLRGRSPSLPRYFYSIQSDSACPQNFFTVRDARFEPGTTASEVRSATNEPPHLQQYILPQSLPCISICPVSISPLCLSLIFLNLYPVLYLQVSTQQQSLSCISLYPVLISPL